MSRLWPVLEMLTKYYNVPFRKDIIERVAKESVKSHQPSLHTLGNLSTLLGFIGTISDIPSGQLYRSTFPCFALFNDELCMIYDISKDKVLAVFPSTGRVSFPLQDLIGDQPGTRILSLSPGRDAQKRKLGFSWFFPQIRKYRRSLIEVLIAFLWYYNSLTLLSL